MSLLYPRFWKKGWILVYIYLFFPSSVIPLHKNVFEYILKSLWAWIFKFGIQVKHLGSNCLTENPASACHISLYLSLLSLYYRAPDKHGLDKLNFSSKISQKL